MIPRLDKPDWGWTEAGVAIGAILPCMLLSGLGYTLSFRLLAGRQPEPVEIAIQSQLLAYIFWLITASFLFRSRQLRFWEQMRWRWPKSGLAVYAALGPALVLALGIVGNLLKIQQAEMPLLDMLLADPIARPLFVLFGVSLGPAVEELLFRGILLPVVAHAAGVWAGLIITSLPFALIHGSQYSWSWQHLALLLLAGIVFGLVRLHADSTLASTITHCAYNLAMFAGYFITKG
jgi:uncharacterized protein